MIAPNLWEIKAQWDRTITERQSQDSNMNPSDSAFPYNTMTF